MIAIGPFNGEIVAIVNGQRITRTDIRRAHQEQQARCLAAKRRLGPIWIPAFVWVFNNGPVIPYGGSHLYVRTRVNDWWISRHYHYWTAHTGGLCEKIRKIYPCGIEPGAETFREWKLAFMDQHRRPDERWPDGNGMALIRALVHVEARQLVDVLPY